MAIRAAGDADGGKEVAGEVGWEASAAPGALTPEAEAVLAAVAWALGPASDFCDSCRQAVGCNDYTWRFTCVS